jgi:GNAT superfamily N-acetyltransferase
VAVFVSDAGGQIVATCMPIAAPNLLRSGRRHGFLENVATRPEFRRQRHGRAVVQAALAEVWARYCYHVLLQSGRKEGRIHRFYESGGFNREFGPPTLRPARHKFDFHWATTIFYISMRILHFRRNLTFRKASIA